MLYLRIEIGEAIEAATPQQNKLNLYTRLAVTIAVVTMSTYSFDADEPWLFTGNWSLSGLQIKRRLYAMNKYSIMGYVIASMRLLGYSRDEIKNVIRDMQISMDNMSEEEAEEVYDEFS